MDPGSRFPLLVYERTVRLQRGRSFWLAILMLGLWWPVSRGMVSWPHPPADGWLLAGGLVCLLYCVFVSIAPRFAYVQAMGDHLRLRTPIYRLNVSYRRVEATRPIEMGRAFPLSGLGGSDRRLLAPLAGVTALAVDLYSMPLSPRFLRLFFSRFILSEDRMGFILAVPDWIELSRQIGSRLDAWRTAHKSRSRAAGVGASAILGDD